VCSLTTTSIGDDGFAQLVRAGDKTCEQRLIKLAREDSVDRAMGLELLLRDLSSWHGHLKLSKVRKVRIGRHRFYISGKHIDCSYCVHYVKVNKRDEEDREEDSNFQNKLLKALMQPVIREITPLT